jgi:hypothetical protein
MGETRGLQAARGIVHLHSPYSWDACDGEPRAADGTVDEGCLASLRRGLCTTRMDFAAVTDHDDSMADESFPTLLLARGADEVLGGTTLRLHCEDGGTVLLTAGGENDLMPLMLDRHPDGDADARHAVYNSSNAATVTVFRELGGLPWIAHTESKDLAALRGLGLDGLEIFNLHAAIDPRIREEHLGLDGDEAIRRVAEFAEQEPTGPEPDLAFLAIFDENVPSLTRWQTLLAEGQRLTGTAGTDAHENALPILLRDGERADSYRRMMRWFSNVVLVEDRADPAQIEEALAAGRAFVAFEVLGTPVGFSFSAGDVEMGGEVAPGTTLIAVTPSVHALAAGLPAPVLRTRILRARADGGADVVAEGTGVVEAVAAEAGAYRAEVRMTPRHLAPYLGSLGPAYSEREVVWIYSNPIYVD